MESELRQWIGREQISDDLVTEDLLRKFYATFDWPDQISPDLPAPPLLHFCLAQPAFLNSELGPDGHPAKGGFLPPVPLPRRMWAGGEIHFHGNLHLGERVRRISRIVDVTEKSGKSGALCFVVVEHGLLVEGERRITERQDIVYRGAETWQAKAETPAPKGRIEEIFVPGPVMLFRYSALTFNSHRIHYDLPYATQAEGYPDLVVHGPLQATLLIDLATKIGGSVPSRFSFRSQSPLFAGDEIRLHASEKDGALHLWTARTGGPIAMLAEAEWATPTAIPDNRPHGQTR